MNVIKSTLFVLLMIFSSITLAADPIVDLIDVPVPVNLDGSQPKIEEVKIAIISAARKRGWIPTMKGDGKILATLLVRSKHYAEVEISYNANTYSIVYKSSRELDYNEKKRKIHRSYNKWVSMLSTSIQREFGVRAQGY
ncbi:MAG: hypothetical protein IPK77_12430 [Cellvibrio sp.]|jgi:hypothetical protein|nr:hypothetical protein [Cellvibrio sp.]